MPGSAVRLYECRVQSVRRKARVLDAISIRGRKFKSLSYLLPYVNSLGGGVLCTPSVGDNCLVVAGERGFETVIGFRLRPAEIANLEQISDDMEEGSVGLRVVGEDGQEARVICFRGGTVVVGSGELAKTTYSPLGAVQHIFDNWSMSGPGGGVKWTRTSGSGKVSYEAEYRVQTDDTADGFRVNVAIADGDVPVSLQVTRKQNDPIPALAITVDKDGIARINGNILEFSALATIRMTAPNFTINGRRCKPIEEPF